MKIWLRESRSIKHDCTYFCRHVETVQKIASNSIWYFIRNIFKHLNKRFPRLIIVGRSVCNNIIVAKYDKIWLCSKVSQNFNSNPRLAKENIAGPWLTRLCAGSRGWRGRLRWSLGHSRHTSGDRRQWSAPGRRGGGPWGTCQYRVKGLFKYNLIHTGGLCFEHVPCSKFGCST